MSNLSDEENMPDVKIKYSMIGEHIKGWLGEMWNHRRINYLFDGLLHNPDESSVNDIIVELRGITWDRFSNLNVDNKNLQDTFFKVEVVTKDDEGNEEIEEVETLKDEDFDLLARSIILAKILQRTYPLMNPCDLISPIFLRQDEDERGLFEMALNEGWVEAPPNNNISNEEEEDDLAQPNDVNETLPQPNDVNETLPQLNDLNETLPQLNDLNETLPQPNDLNGASPQPNDLNETLPQPNDLNETLPQPNDLNETLPTEGLIMPKVSKKKEDDPIIPTEKSDEEDTVVIKLQNIPEQDEENEELNQFVHDLELSQDLPFPPSSSSSSQKRLEDTPIFGDSHSFKAVNYPPPTPNTFQKVCKEFGKTMDLIYDEWRDYLTEVWEFKDDTLNVGGEDIFNGDFGDRDLPLIPLSLTHNLSSSTSNECGGYFPVFLHFDVFIKLWTLFFLQKQNICKDVGKKGYEYTFSIEKFICSQVVIRPEDGDIECMLQAKTRKKKEEEEEEDEGKKGMGDTKEEAEEVENEGKRGEVHTKEKSALSMSSICFDSSNDGLLANIKEISYKLGGEAMEKISKVSLVKDRQKQDPMFGLRGRVFYLNRNDESAPLFSTLLDLGFREFLVNPCHIEHIPIKRGENKIYYLEDHDHKQIVYSSNEQTISFPINGSGDSLKVKDNDVRDIISLVKDILFGHTQLLEQV